MYKTIITIPKLNEHCKTRHLAIWALFEIAVSQKDPDIDHLNEIIELAMFTKDTASHKRNECLPKVILLASVYYTWSKETFQNIITKTKLIQLVAAMILGVWRCFSFYLINIRVIIYIETTSQSIPTHKNQFYKSHI